MRHRDKLLWIDIGKTIALFGGIIATVMFCMWWFPRVDCSTALNALAFYEKCDKHESCMLHPDEEKKARAMTRLMLQRCPADRLPEDFDASDID
jgi:hypothetical protein